MPKLDPEVQYEVSERIFRRLVDGPLDHSFDDANPQKWVSVKVEPDGRPRITSAVSGSSYWLDGWSGMTDALLAWCDEVGNAEVLLAESEPN